MTHLFFFCYNALIVYEPTEKDEYEKIEDELKKLSERKLELQALKENLEGSGKSKELQVCYMFILEISTTSFYLMITDCCSVF